MAGERESDRAGGRWGWADRETLLDVLVNVVPMGVLLFFLVLSVVVHPWPFDLARDAMALFLTAFPLVVLALVTYVSAKVISRDERRA